MSASSTGKIAVALVLMAGAATALLLACRAQARLREQNRLLERRIQELARAARPGQLVPAQTGLDLPLSPQEESELLRLRGEVGVLRREKSELSQLQADNRRLRQTFFSELLNGNARLDLQQLAPYLEAKQRNAGSLLAAWRATGQQALLQEATDKYPGEPRARLAACLAWSATDGTSRDERRSRLEAFKQSAPDNALAYYLSAEAYFENDQPDRALREMAAVPADRKSIV